MIAGCEEEEDEFLLLLGLVYIGTARDLLSHRRPCWLAEVVIPCVEKDELNSCSRKLRLQL